jgi:hypothetical protein
MGREVLIGAGCYVTSLLGEDRFPEVREGLARDLHLASPDRFVEPLACPCRRATTRKATPARHRSVGLAKDEPPADAALGGVGVDTLTTFRCWEERTRGLAPRGSGTDPRAHGVVEGLRLRRRAETARALPSVLSPADHPWVAGGVVMNAHPALRPRGTGWGTCGVPHCHRALPRGVPPWTAEPVRERGKPRHAGLSGGAPKRTRTSTRLSRTRPSTWRVYQFRHRREGAAEYSPGLAR